MTLSLKPAHRETAWALSARPESDGHAIVSVARDYTDASDAADTTGANVNTISGATQIARSMLFAKAARHCQTQTVMGPEAEATPDGDGITMRGVGGVSSDAIGANITAGSIGHVRTGSRVEVIHTDTRVA